MGEILGLGLTHHPRYLGPPENFPIVPYLMRDPALPAFYRDTSNWPETMREQWSNDNGLAYATQHQANMRSGFERVRARLDEFNPDVVVIFGDDQYENFREDIVPAFAVLAHQEHVAERQFDTGGDTEEIGPPIVARGHPEAGRMVADGLLARDFDAAYAYQPLHSPTLAHAFANTLAFLDTHGDGFPYAVLPIPINCYGRKLISHRGARSPLGGEAYQFDPRSPRPGRVMDMGAAVAQIMLDSPWRTAIIGSSSWSHAFLCEMNGCFWPDVEGDRQLYQALVAGDYHVWRNLSLDEVEQRGLQELLNWCALVGSMELLCRKPEWSVFLESYICNSDIVFATF